MFLCYSMPKPLTGPLLALLVVVSGLAGCATLAGGDAPDVRVVGLEPLPSEGLELRFALQLRIQNPNDAAIAYDGVAVKLDLDGRGLASGVSDAKGTIARFSEELVSVPVSLSAFSALRQVLGGLGRMESGRTGKQVLRYALSGKLGRPDSSGGAIRFTDEGQLDLFSESAPQAR